MMDYRKIMEDLMAEGRPVDEELRYAAAASIRELLVQKMELTSQLTLAKKCLGENEDAYAAVKRELDIEREAVRDFFRTYSLLREAVGI